MSPTLASPWARLRVTEVRFGTPAARNISPESSRPFPFASVRESETPLLRVIGRLERVPFPDEPSACTKRSEERRVGKECRWRWAGWDSKKKGVVRVEVEAG